MPAQQPKALKPHKTYAQQLDLLQQRGLAVADRDAALIALERLGYYRLSGYFYPLRKTLPPDQSGRQDDFQPGASFELVTALAEFDKRMRLLALYAIETIEIAVRVAVAYRLGRLDPLAHRQAKLFDGRFTAPGRQGGPSRHARWLTRFDALCEQSSEDFVVHHDAAYGGQLPLWAAIEVWDFGLLSRFFQGMQSRDQNAVANRYGLDGASLESWLRGFNFVRNVSAHHSRLWNRRNPEIPRLPSIDRCRWLACLHQDTDARSRMFGAFSCMALMLRTLAPQSEWRSWVKALATTFPQTDLLTIRSAGFVDGWQGLPLWVD